MSFILGALKIIFVLGFLVFIHEGGHFLIARACKVNVKEFSIGFGPTIFSKKGKFTKYSIRLIPFGGFVDMVGETERKDEEGSFSNTAVWKRILIVAAGAIVNIVFGLILFFSLISITGNNQSTIVDKILPECSSNLEQLKENDQIIAIDNQKIYLKTDINEILNKIDKETVNLTVKRNNEIIEIEVTTSKQLQNVIGVYFESEENFEIAYIEKDSPADKVGLEVGDKIISINNNEKLTSEEISNQIQNSEIINIVVQRDSKKIEYKLQPIQEKYYFLGIYTKQAENNFRNNIYYGFWETVVFVEDIFNNLLDLLKGNVSINNLSGPIGISEHIVKTSTIYNFVYLMSLISLSLGITNLLPIPALDGGRIVLLLIEAIKRKPLSEKFENTIQMIGFLFIISLAVIISFNDIIRII